MTKGRIEAPTKEKTVKIKGTSKGETSPKEVSVVALA